MKYCTECGKAINMTDKFCSHCGSPSVNGDTSNQSDSGKPTKVEVDPTEQNENSGVYLDEDGIPFKSKDASKSLELEWLKKDGNYKNRKFRQPKHKDTNNKFTITIISIIVIILFIFIMYVNSMNGPYGDAVRTSKELSRNLDLILMEIEEHNN